MSTFCLENQTPTVSISPLVTLSCYNLIILINNPNKELEMWNGAALFKN